MKLNLGKKSDGSNSNLLPNFEYEFDHLFLFPGPKNKFTNFDSVLSNYRIINGQRKLLMVFHRPSLSMGSYLICCGDAW